MENNTNESLIKNRIFEYLNSNKDLESRIDAEIEKRLKKAVESFDSKFFGWAVHSAISKMIDKKIISQLENNENYKKIINEEYEKLNSKMNNFVNKVVKKEMKYLFKKESYQNESKGTTMIRSYVREYVKNMFSKNKL